jgi:hypothetical protein
MRRNYFVFLEKEENLSISMRLLRYGADVSRNEQRSLGNVKPGDLVLIWVPETKLLYGVFEVQNRVFYDETDVGWTNLWPYRCSFKLWDGYLRVIPDELKANLMSFVSRELVTLSDLTNLGGYIHTLMYDEGSKFFAYFLAKSKMRQPISVFPDFACQAAPVPAPKEFSEALNPTPRLTEYVLEMYLLQHHEKLEEFVGTNISELYNMLFSYQRRYLDIMTVHRDENNKPFKTTILELKTEISEARMETGLDELSSYMFWVQDQITKGRLQGPADCVFGMLVSPRPSDRLKEQFRNRCGFYATQYGIESDRLHYVSYDVRNNEAFFTIEV